MPEDAQEGQSENRTCSGPFMLFKIKKRKKKFFTFFGNYLLKVSGGSWKYLEVVQLLQKHPAALTFSCAEFSAWISNTYVPDQLGEREILEMSLLGCCQAARLAPQFRSHCKTIIPVY